MSADDLDRMQTVGDNACTDDEVIWCKQTIRYLRGLLDNQGLIDRCMPVSDLRRTSRRMENAAAAAAATAAVAAATAATPPPRGRERRVEADGTPRDSDLELSKGIGRSRGRNRGGRSGGGGRVHRMRYGLHFSAYFWA